MTQLSDEFKGVSLSHATLRESDLIQAFKAFLAAELPDDYQSFEVHYQGDLAWDEPEMLDERWYPDEVLEVASWLVEELIETLNQYAPEGYYFGAHVGDGSDFGFWPLEEEQS